MSHKLRTEHDVVPNRLRIMTAIAGPSRTVQSHAASTDINAIVDRYTRTGDLPIRKQSPQYGDATPYQGKDLAEAFNDAEKQIQEVKTDLQKIEKHKNGQKQKQQNELIEKNKTLQQELDALKKQVATAQPPPAS